MTYNDGTDLEAAAALAATSDVAIVMVGDDSREGADRATLNLPVSAGVNQEALIEAVAAANAKTIVVLKNGGPIVTPWLDKVPAVLEAWYPGQEDAHAVANVLFGKTNPSGKLPMTFPTDAAVHPISTPEQFPGVDPDGAGPLRQTVKYTEGLEMGYRWYDANGVAPQFAFGHGLSYTDFEISNVAIERSKTNASLPIDVTFDITNVGDRAGAEGCRRRPCWRGAGPGRSP